MELRVLPHPSLLLPPPLFSQCESHGRLSALAVRKIEDISVCILIDKNCETTFVQDKHICIQQGEHTLNVKVTVRLFDYSLKGSGCSARLGMVLRGII